MSSANESNPVKSETLAEHLSAQYQYQFRNAELLRQALTHKSYKNESPQDSCGDNERLEFLGDAVLDLALTTDLMERFPDYDEGKLSKMRASLVNEMMLAEIAKVLQLDQELRLGKGERQTGGSSKPRLLACGFEALLGAIYQDSDFATANVLIRKIFEPHIEQLDLITHYRDDYKTRLQEKIQGQAGARHTPHYEVEKSEGPDHEKVFHVVLHLGGEVLARGRGRSKKQAEQEAARMALEILEREP